MEIAAAHPEFRRLVPAVALVLALAGCEASIRGAPSPSLEAERDFSATIINATLARERLESLALGGGDRMQRNAIIHARLSELDRLYYDYERDLGRELRESGFVLSLAGLAVGGAGSFAGQTASRILSAVSAGLSGAQDAYAKDVLVDQTIQALLAQMRAARDSTKASMLPKLSLGVDVYPIQAAISDLEAYRQAGTLTSALVGVTQSAGQAERAAQERLRATEGVVLRFEGRVSDLEPAKQARAVAIVAAIRDERRTSDSRVLALAAAPAADDPAFGATLAPYRAEGALENAAIARIALSDALLEMERSEANLAAWEAALGL